MPWLIGPDNQRIKLSDDGSWRIVPFTGARFEPGGDPTKSPEANMADLRASQGRQVYDPSGPPNQ